MRRITTALCLAAVALCPFTQAAKPQQKPAIIIVAFGTSVPKARKVFDHIMSSAQKKFPGYKITYGFTARSIVKKLRKEGTDKGVLTLEEAIATAKKEGYSKIVLQSLHIVPGQKDAELKAANTHGMKAYFGKPLLSSDADINAALAAVKNDIAPNMPNVFCGHGNDHHPEYNAMLVRFNNALIKKYPGALMCTVEGKPGAGTLESVVKPQLAKNGGKVNFVPFMIVAGDHIMNDVAGDEDDSWKNIIKARQPSVKQPLGYNDAILAIFWQHLDNALKQAQM